MSRRTLEEWDGELGCVRRLRACQFFHKMSHALLVVDLKQFALFVFLVALGTTWLLISGSRFVVARWVHNVGSRLKTVSPTGLEYE